jgi:hypothetical protein
MTTNVAGLIGVTEIQMMGYFILAGNAFLGFPWLTQTMGSILPQAAIQPIAQITGQSVSKVDNYLVADTFT